MSNTQKDLKRSQELMEQKVETKEKERTSREILGKYLYDLSKLVFGVMVLGVIIPWLTDDENKNYWLIFGVGLFSTIILALFGNRILKS